MLGRAINPNAVTSYAYETLSNLPTSIADDSGTEILADDGGGDLVGTDHDTSSANNARRAAI